MKKKVLITLLMVLILGFLTQVITVAQIPTTPPASDSTNQQTFGPPSSDELPELPPWIVTPLGCEWVQICDPHGFCFWILICESWVPKLGQIYIP
jgi:hypothetical protein